MENEGEERSRLLVLGESRGVVAVAIGLQGGVQETIRLQYLPTSSMVCRWMSVMT